MTARKSYETAVKAFRAGAADVVLKEPDVVPYLRERVVEAATDIKATAERNSLLEEVAETHEEFLRRMRDIARSASTWRTAARRARRAATTATTVSVVLVDDDPAAAREAGEGAHRRRRAGIFAGRSRAARRWTSSPRRGPQIVMVKEDLPDLPGSMVVTTVKAGTPDAVTLLYSRPAAAGRARSSWSTRAATMNLVAELLRPRAARRRR